MIRFLDGLFVCTFGSVPLDVLGIGTRVALASTDRRLIMLTTALATIGAIGAVLMYLWAAIFVARQKRSPVRQPDWAYVVRRYPVLIGPAAYYVGAYRPRQTGHASWIDAVMQRRRVLDTMADGAWWGTLATYWSLLGAVVAALLQSSALLTLVVVMFVLLLVSSGAAFCLLAVVVLIHFVIVKPSDSPAARHFKGVPSIGVLWVREFRQYYRTAMRPSLVASEGRRR